MATPVNVKQWAKNVATLVDTVFLYHGKKYRKLSDDGFVLQIATDENGHEKKDATGGCLYVSFGGKEATLEQHHNERERRFSAGQLRRLKLPFS